MNKKNKPTASNLLNIEQYTNSIMDKVSRSPIKDSKEIKSTAPVVEQEEAETDTATEVSTKPSLKSVKKSMGRPKSNHGKQPFTVLISPKILKKLKLKAINKDMQINELLDDILSDYLG